MTPYIVKSGDSLSKIALAFYGTYNPIGAWSPIDAIAKANNITNVNLISPGQTLNIPDKPAAAPTGTSVATTTASSGSVKTTPTTQQQQQAPPPPSSKGMSNGTKTLLILLLATGLAAGAAVGYKKYKQRKQTKPKAA